MQKSPIFYVSGVLQSTCCGILQKVIFFFRLKQKFKMFKKSYFTRSRSRTPTNSKDGAICNNSLQLKGVYYSIVTRSSILNVGIRGPRPNFTMIANLRILQWKVQKLEQPSIRKSFACETMLLPQMILKTTIWKLNAMQFNVISHFIRMSFVCHSYVIVHH